MTKVENIDKIGPVFESMLPDFIEIMNESGLSKIKFEDGDVLISIEKNIPQKNINIENEIKNENNGTNEKEEMIIYADRVGRFVNMEKFTGNNIKKGDILGYIESINLQHEVKSPCHGLIKEILVENQGTVEYKQPMFIIISEN